MIGIVVLIGNYLTANDETVGMFKFIALKSSTALVITSDLRNTFSSQYSYNQNAGCAIYELTRLSREEL